MANEYSRKRLSIRRPLETLFLVLLLLVSIIFINFEISDPLLDIIKTIYMISFIVFIPGYLLVKLLFRKNLGTGETLVLSMGVSIALVILSGILINYSAVVVSAVNILNLMSFFVFVIIVASIFKKDFRWTGGKKKSLDKGFLFYIFVVVLAIASMMYLSVTLPPEEEFVEVSWVLSEATDLNYVENPNCGIDICSLGGANMAGKVGIGDEVYQIMLADLNFEGKYDSICIDFDGDGTFCEGEEGPIWPTDTFFVGNSAYSYNIVGQENVVVLNFPKEVETQNFTVSYNVKSYYSAYLDYDLFITLNETTLSRKRIGLNPGEEVVISQDVSLPDEGAYRVRVDVFPVGKAEKASINFLVSYSEPEY